MNAEFNWWLLIVGLVAGAGLVWLVITDWSRRDEDLARDERSAESAWIAQTLQERGLKLDPGDAEEVLELHRAYLRHLGGYAFDGPEPAELPDEAAATTTTSTATDDDAAPDARPRPADAAAATETLAAASTVADDSPESGEHVSAGYAAPAPRPPDAQDRSSVRARSVAPRGGAGMDAEPPRPS